MTKVKSGHALIYDSGALDFRQPSYVVAGMNRGSEGFFYKTKKKRQENHHATTILRDQLFKHLSPFAIIISRNGYGAHEQNQKTDGNTQKCNHVYITILRKYASTSTRPPTETAGILPSSL